MAGFLLANIPIAPKLPIKTNNSLCTTSSPQTSISEKYSTPQIRIQNNKTSSDSDSTLTDQSSIEDTDYEDSLNTSTEQDSLNVPTSKIDINLKLENNEAEFFASSPTEDASNHKHKLSIRSAFHKKFHRLTSDTSHTDTNEWNEVLVTTLVSMQQEIQEIISGLEQIDQPITDDSQLNTSESIIEKPHLSFLERQREKLEMMRLAQMLHPPNLLTYNIKESPYPYTDIIEPHNFNFLRMTKQIPDENLFIQHKPFRHRKFRYRIQRGVLRIRRDLKKLKSDLYGKRPLKSHQELSSVTVQNYRNRLEKTIHEVRKQITEYDRIHSSMDNEQKRISEVIKNINTIDPKIKAQMEDYQTKLRPIEYVNKKQNQLISAPFIPPRARYRPNDIEKENTTDCFIDTRFDLTTFVDLHQEAEEFFGPDIPFWNRPPASRLSISASSYLKRQSNRFVLPSKLGVWDRMVGSFKMKQKNLRKLESKQNQSDEKNEEFFDCISSFEQGKSQPSNSFNENDSVYF